MKTIQVTAIVVCLAGLLTACATDRDVEVPRSAEVSFPSDPYVAELAQRAGEILTRRPPFANTSLAASRECETTLLGYPGDGLFAANVQCVNAGGTGFHVYETVNPMDDSPGSDQVHMHFGSAQQSISTQLPGVSGTRRAEGTREATARDGGGPYAFPVGKRGDRFVLGDHRTVYYAGKTHPEDRDTGFVYIQYFEPEHSLVQLHGSPDDYVLVPVREPETGTAIFLRENDDLIAFIRRVTPDRLSELDGQSFVYEQAPEPRPVIPGVVQISSAGPMPAIGVIEPDDAGRVYIASAGIPEAIPTAEAADGSLLVGRVAADGEIDWLHFYDNTDAGLRTDTKMSGEAPWDLELAHGSLYACSIGAVPGTTETPGDTNFGRLWRIDPESGEVVAAVETNEWFGGRWTTCAAMTSDGAGHLYVHGAYQSSASSPVTVPYIAKLNADDLSVVWLAGDVYEPEERTGLQRVLLREAWGGIEFHQTGPQPGNGYVVASGYTWTKFLLRAAGSGPEVGGDASPISVYATRYSSEGEKAWRIEFGGNGVDWPRASDVDSQGNYYIGGLSTSTEGLVTTGPQGLGAGEGFMARINPDGEIAWIRQITSPDGEEVRDVHIGRVDGQELIFASGHVFTDATGSTPYDPRRDVYAISMTREGEIRRRVQFGSEKDEHATIGLGGGFVYLGGQTYGSMVGPNEGGIDFYLTRLTMNGLDFAPVVDRSGR